MFRVCVFGWFGVEFGLGGLRFGIPALSFFCWGGGGCLGCLPRGVGGVAQVFLLGGGAWGRHGFRISGAQES